MPPPFLFHALRFPPVLPLLPLLDQPWRRMLHCEEEPRLLRSSDSLGSPSTQTRCGGQTRGWQSGGTGTWTPRPDVGGPCPGAVRRLFFWGGGPDGSELSATVHQAHPLASSLPRHGPQHRVTVEPEKIST